MEGRLQFKYDEHLYLNKADIKAHIEEQVKDVAGKYALFAEPIVFKYGEDAKNPNIILAIGSYGSGIQNSNNKYFLIDSAQMEKDIAELQEGLSGYTEEINELKRVLTNTLNSVGLDENGKIVYNEKHHIGSRKYIKGKDDILLMLMALDDAIVAEENTRLANDVIISNALSAETNERIAADSAETVSRIQGDKDSKDFAYNLYNESVDNSVKIVNKDENTKEVFLKIKDEEKILSQNTYGLTTTLNINFDSSAQTLQLKGINGTIISEIDATPFIKDGFLYAAVIIDDEEKQKELDPDGWAQGYNRFPYILLVWKTEAELIPTRIPLDELIDIYKAGNGLQLNDHTFSIKLDSTCEPFLTVGENGINLSGVNAAIETAKKEATTKLEKDIHAVHLELSSRTESDNSKTYILNESNIASDSDLQQFKNDIRDELDLAITALSVDVDERISEAIADEVINRNAAIDVVKNNLSAETAERKTEISRVEGLVSHEATLRTNADNVLEDKISEERNDRKTADTTLQSNINNEKSLRETADNQLKGLIETEKGERTSGYTVLDGKISAEETARIASDNNIKNNLIGTGFEGKTLTSAITENANAITKINNTIGSGFSETTITNVVDKISKKLETTYSAVTANTTDITSLKNKVGNGLEGGETLTIAVENAKSDIQEIDSAITMITSTLVNKVDKVEGSSLMTSAEHTKLAGIEEGADVNKIEIVKRNGTSLEISSDKSVNIEVPFEQVAENEKQLVLNNGTLSSVFSVEYDESANTIYFLGKNSSILGTLDTSKFVTESFLKDVKVVQIEGVKYLVFEFIKSDGTTKEVRVKLTDLVTEYTVSGDSKSYLKIEGFEIGVKVNTADRTGLATEVNLHDLDDKYSAITHNMEDIVGVGFSGETITHRIITIEDVLRELIDSDMKLKEDFQVAGIYGILGTGAYKNGDVIPAGTSLMTIVKNILQKELNPTAVLPTVELSLTNDKLTFEVGSTVIPTFKIVFTDGKYVYENGSERWAITEADNYAVYVGESSTPVSQLPQGALPQITIEDSTDYKIMSIVHHTAGEQAKTNLGKDYPDATITTANIVSHAGTIKGYRSYFFGTLSDEISIPDTGTTDWSATARTLLSMSEEAPSEILIPIGAEKIVIAIPGNSSMSISKIYDSQTGYDITDNFTLIKNVIMIGGYNSYNPIYYNVYVMDPDTSLSGRKFYILYK